MTAWVGGLRDISPVDGGDIVGVEVDGWLELGMESVVDVNSEVEVLKVE